jgi:integrase
LSPNLKRSLASLNVSNFTFGNHSITEAQAASIAYPTKIKASGNTPEHWVLRYFSAAKANKVAAGRVGQPRDKKSYIGREQARDDQGGLYPPSTPRTHILMLCERRAQEEVTKAKWEIQDRGVELWQKCRKDLISDRWAQWREVDSDGRNLSEKTVAAYERYLHFILENHPQLQTLADIEDGVFADLKLRNSALIQDKKPYVGQPYAARTLRNVERAFKCFLEWGKDEGILPPHLFLGNTKLRKVDGPKRRNNASPFKDEADLEAFLSFGSATPIGIALLEKTRAKWAHRFRFMAYTGLRSDEALNLKWENVFLDGEDADNPYIWITPDLSKTNTERRIGLLGEARSALKALRSQAKKVPTKQDPVFEGVSYGALYRVFSDWEKAYYEGTDEHRTPHMLRGFFTNHLITRNCPIHIAAAWSGHTIQILEKHYLEKESKELSEGWVKKLDSDWSEEKVAKLAQ